MANQTELFIAVNHNWSEFETGLAIIILALVDVGAILLNLMVMCIIFTDRVLREKTDCFLIANLAFSDLLVAATIIPFSINTLINRSQTYSSATSFFIGFANFVFCIGSIMTLMLLVIDQTLVIKWPLRYDTFRTRKTALVASVSAWLYSTGCALPPMFGLSSYNCFISNIGPCSDYEWAGTNSAVVFTVIVTTASWGLAAIVTVICYIQIAIIAVKQSKIAESVKYGSDILRSSRERCISASVLQAASSNGADEGGIGDKTCVTTVSDHSSRKSRISAIFIRHKVSSNEIETPVLSRNISVNYGVATIVNSMAVNILAIEAQQGHLTSAILSVPSNNMAKSSATRRRLEKVKRLNHVWRPAKTLLLIICAYFCTWSPFCILLMIEIAQKRKIFPNLSLVFLWMGHSSSLLNPVLYFLRYERFRSTARRFWKKVLAKCVRH